MNNEVKNISTIQYILASVGTLIIVGLYIVLRYGLMLNADAIDLRPEDKVLIYVIAGIFALIYITLIENITRWTKLGVIAFGTRSYNKKNVEGYPINESFSGYKYVNANQIINDGIDSINMSNDMDTFEDVVWYANQEMRQKAYNRLLRKQRKILNKKYRKAFKRHQIETSNELLELLDKNRADIGITNDLLECINKLDRDKVIEIDTYLYELYDITAKEFDAQVLLDDEGTGAESWIDRIRMSKLYYIITVWVLPVILGVSAIIVGFMYEWKFDDILSSSEVILLNAIIIYLVTKIPTVAFKAYTIAFKNNQLTPKLNAAHVFRLYKNRKLKKNVEKTPED